MTMQRLVSHLFTLFLAVLLSGVFSSDAEARRLGGGKSFGRQSSNVIQRQATPPKAPSQANQAAGQQGAGAAAAGRKSMMGGMLGGLAAGLGLAWLAHALGLGPAFANFLLIVLLGVVALAVFGALRRRREAGAGSGPMAYQGAGNTYAPPQYNPTKVGNDASARPWEAAPAQFSGSGRDGSIIGSALGGSQNWGVPADFDVAGFVEAAKRNFITLQGAWDRGDLPTLRTMMTDDMLDEIRSQLAERERHAPGKQHLTEVVMLDAQLLGIEELDDLYMASVEFSGMIREDVSTGPSPFREVWNMTKPKSGRGGWLVAGLQAMQ